MLLHFFLAKLKPRNGGIKQAELCLRFTAEGAVVDFAKTEAVLEAFCFPLGPEPPKEFAASEEYTFTLTHGDGKRFQGFCRKVLPPPPKVGSRLRYPQVLCIISEFPWYTFYFKVLQVAELLLRLGDAGIDGDPAQLPSGCHAFKFLQDLVAALRNGPEPGQTLRIPFAQGIGLLGASPPRNMTADGSITWGDDYLELQVPPDCGNGKWNCGVSLARLLWHVPVSALLTLISAMLLERRIVIIGSSRDTVTAVVQAAAALLYPFRWHHIYLPLLPKQLKDYLAAPMPFLVGLPAQMLPALKGLCMDEVTLVDLDLGKCDPAPGSPRDDAVLLPWRDHLEAALSTAYSQLRSPTEFESSPLISGIMQEYFLRLIGDYPRFIHEDTSTHSSHGRQPLSTASGAMRGRVNSADKDMRSLGDSALKGFGYVFEQAAFISHHRKSDKARRFLSMFRQSQMYEVFIQERLQRTAEGRVKQAAFEMRLARYQERRRLRRQSGLGGLTHGLLSQSQPQLAAAVKVSALLLKKHRTDSASELPLGSRDSDKRPLGTSGVAAIDPAGFFDDIADPDWLDNQLPWSGDSPVHTRDLRAASAMPALQDMQQLRTEFSNRSDPQRSSDSSAEFRTQLRSELARGSVPSLTAPNSADRSRHGSGEDKADGGGSTTGGLTFSFHSGNRLYEGSFTSIIKAMWAGKGDGGPADVATAPVRQVLACSAHEQSGAPNRSWHGPENAAASTNCGTAPQQQQASNHAWQKPGSERSKFGQAQRHVPQSHAGPSLLDSSCGGRLMQPPAPARPLNASAHQPQTPQAVGSEADGALYQVPSMSSLVEAPAATVHAAGKSIKSGVSVDASAVTGSVSTWDPFGLAPNVQPASS